MNTHAKPIAQELSVRPAQVSAVSELLAGGATIPFISRYRKEATGGLDEVQISTIRDQLNQRAELDKRREVIVASLTERQLLTPPLEQAIGKAQSLTVLEDLYLPHRPKRRTRAAIARERGLEPLATALLSQGGPLPEAKSLLNPEQQLSTEEEVLAGARDIIAEKISEEPQVRTLLRQLFSREAQISSKVVEKNREQGGKFKDYFDRREAAAKVAGHRFLAMLRGEQEKVLRLTIRPPEEHALELLSRRYPGSDTFRGQQLQLACTDAYRRLLAPSLENELRAELKAQADREAITVFADNLRELLLAPPLGQKRVLALDPGFRTGAKLVCLDRYGSLLHHTTIYPTLSASQQQQAAETVRSLCSRHRIEAIAIGNGTAGRETERFIQELGLGDGVLVTMVDESGASIYSASEIARQEFPDHDLTVRGAISIGRRLQDPLAELVKLDPKSIGVGQYQHDVQQKALKQGLDEVVIRCVNMVGVDLNTASEPLLTYISGLGPTLARNIVAMRRENGPFASRRGLLKVPRLGAKAYEQCAGFLRIREADNPLDNTGVHPERYPLVQQMAKDQGCSLDELIDSQERRRKIQPERYLSDTVGMPTLKDILAELEKPGRDPRAGFTSFAFAEGVEKISDLEPGMTLPGIVTNVTKFGAFVDIGVHQDGLVHISQLADRFVRDPGEIVKVRQQVEVRVLEVDPERKRISLSMRRA
ncbi:Tex family protein [Desulfogranum mediterraneum]|uniref:Tex family protein n=1 Tax=Desulfogranum mediterraneum TaxID=160661 RepID=UPI00040DC904|nr:Tex family protein [Desulfogranum mediterraneum]